MDIKHIPLNDILKEYKEINSNSLYKPVAVGRYGIRTRESIYKKELAKDYSKNKVISKDTLTIGMGSKQIDIGILSENNKYSVSPAYHTFNIENIDSDYLRYCLQYWNNDMSERYMIASSRQGKTIDFKRWLTYEIPVYKRKMQIDIVYELDIIHEAIDKLCSKLSMLVELIKSRFSVLLKLFKSSNDSSKNVIFLI